MGTIEIFPDLLIKEAGSKTLVGGASALAVLSDLSDASYLRAAGTTPAQSYSATFRMGPLTGIPAGSLIRRIQLRMRYSHFQKASAAREIIQPVSALVGRSLGSVHSYWGFTTGESVPSYSLSTSPQVWTGPFRGATWDGKYWLNDLISRSGARFYASMQVNRQWAWSLARIYSLSLLVHWNEKPTGTLVEPSGTEVVSRPDFIWTYDDPEGDAQAFWAAAIFDQATTLLPGFVVDFPDWDVNKAPFKPVYYANGWGAQTEHTPEKPFGTDGNYVAYWIGTQAMMTNLALDTGWQSSAFVLDTEGPVTPALTAVYDAVVNGIVVTANGKDNLLDWALSSAEAGTSSRMALGSNVGVTTTGAQASHGSNSFQFTKNVSAGSITASMPSALGTQYGAPVSGSTQYTARAKFRTAVTGRLCRVGLSFYTSAGAIIGALAYGATITDTNAGFTEAVYTVTSPANAAFARLHIDVQSAAVDEVHYVDQLGILPGTQAWNRGGYADSDTRVTLFQRTIDGGTTWEDVPDSQLISAGLFAIFADYEVPSGATGGYRVRAEAEDQDGSRMVGDWSTMVSAAMPTFTSWWLRDLADPSLSMALHTASMAGTMPVPGTSDYPLGSDAAVMSTDGIKKGTLKLQVFTLSQTAWDSLLALLESNRTLLLQDTLGEQWYVRPSEFSYERLRAPALGAEAAAGQIVRHAHSGELSLSVVERPIERFIT